MAAIKVLPFFLSFYISLTKTILTSPLLSASTLQHSVTLIEGRNEWIREWSCSTHFRKYLWLFTPVYLEKEGCGYDAGHVKEKVILWVDTGDIFVSWFNTLKSQARLKMNKHSVAIYSTGADRYTNKISFVHTKNSAMFRLNMWSQGWPKHVAVRCVCKLITIYVCKCVGSIILLIQLKQQSCTIHMKFPLHSKPMPSPSQQLDSNAINVSDRSSSWSP